MQWKRMMGWVGMAVWVLVPGAGAQSLRIEVPPAGAEAVRVGGDWRDGGECESRGLVRSE
jgi:hypothetical protein